jgi:hypothetical protein
MQSFSYVFDQPVQFQQAPELFCLDFFKEFDIGQLETLASPAKVRNSAYVTSPVR